MSIPSAVSASVAARKDVRDVRSIVMLLALVFRETEDEGGGRERSERRRGGRVKPAAIIAFEVSDHFEHDRRQYE